MSERAMMAHLSKSGTAMTETALCTDCRNPETVKSAYAAAGAAGDWNGGHNQNCTGNQELICQNCGWIPPETSDEVDIEMTLKVYMKWDREVQKWIVDSPSLDGYALDLTDSGLYCDNDGDYRGQDDATRAEWDKALDAQGITARELLGLLNDAFDYRLQGD